MLLDELLILVKVDRQLTKAEAVKERFRQVKNLHVGEAWENAGADMGKWDAIDCDLNFIRDYFTP